MRVYDFDNTIYNGESVVDFFMFLLNKEKKLFVFLPIVSYIAVLYKTGKLDTKQVYQLANNYSDVVKKYQDVADKYIEEFWKENIHKLKKGFLEHITPDDIIITASPNILIQKIQPYLKTKRIICTDYDLENGKLNFLCLGKNKVDALKKQYPDIIIDEFYTDSLNDMSLISISETAYLVSGNKMFPINPKHKSKIERK